MIQLRLLLILLTIGYRLPAREVPSVRNFLPTDYNAENQNWALAQTADGWLYAGNNRGLLEFDGARWQLYSLPEGQTVRAVAVGEQGQIFCGGYGEFGFWQRDSFSGRLSYHSLSRLLPASAIGSEEIWHILAGPGYMLFQSFSVLYKYDYQTVEVLHPPQAIMFARMVGGRVLLPVIGQGLYELLPDHTFRLQAGTEVLADKIVQFVTPGPDGIVWIGTAGHGLYEWRPGAPCRPSRHPLNGAFRQNQLNKALALTGGGWAIGTILGGVYVLDTAGQLRYQLDRSNGLQNNTVLALFEDRDGNLWAGLDRGIDRVALRSPLRFYNDQTGALGTVYGAARHEGRLYIGTNQGLFVRDATDEFQLVAGTQGQVWQLRTFGAQLLCGHNAGTFSVTGEQARLISNITGGLCTVEVPGQPDLLLQSTYTGLIVFRRAGRSWQLSQRVSGFSAPLRRIAFDKWGRLWGVHLNKGLFRLEFDQRFERVSGYKVFYRGDGLESDLGLDLQTIGSDLLVNTRTAPVRLPDSGGTAGFRAVESALSGRQHWLAGYGAEFFRLDSSGIYLESSGRPYFFALRLVPAYETIVALDSNEYLFCLEYGYALFDRRAAGTARASGPPPPPSVHRVEVAGNALAVGPVSLIVPYGQNSLTFYFSMPAFDRPPKFSWRLEGYSDQWSAWQEQPEKEFNNLPPGNYVLHLRSDTGTAEARLPFRIEPPWYRRPWAWTTYALGALAFLYSLEQWYRRRLARQRRRLEADTAQELERQRGLAEREKLAIEVETKTRELSNAALNLIRKNEVLQELKDALQSPPTGDAPAPRALVRRIDRHLDEAHDWEIFEQSFNAVHDDFFKRLLHDYPDLTPGDLRLAAYLRLNLSSKEIAPLLNISVRGVENKRYRLRKKLGLEEEANLTEFILNY